MAVLTISRQVGAGGAYIGQKVAESLGYHCADKAIMEKAFVQYGFISDETADRLVPYLTFRHLYRNAYVLDLRPDRMQVLLDDINKMFIKFEDDIL